MEDDFDILAAKVLAGEATPHEAARLEEILAGNAQLRAEFAGLEATWAALKEGVPVASALDAQPAAPPPERLKEWRAELARKFGTAPGAAAVPLKRNRTDFAQVGPWFLKRLGISPLGLGVAAAILVVGIITGVLVLRRPGGTGPIAYLVAGEGVAEVHRSGKATTVHSVTILRHSDEVHLPPRTSVTVITSNGAVVLRGPQRISPAAIVARVRDQTNAPLGAVHGALFQPPEQMSALLVTTRNNRSIPVYSPAGFTASLTPPILWKAQPGKTYAVAIADELSAGTVPLRRDGVTSPLQFTNAWPGRALEKDGLYRLRITETGKPLTATEFTFRTLPQENVTPPSDPAEKLAAAYHLLTANPSCLGDALAILLTLSPKATDSELALRLKLFAFGQLGYQDDFEATFAAIEKR